MNSKDLALDLINFIDDSPCAFFAVKAIEDELLKNDYKELKEEDKWDISLGGKYFIKKNDSAILAFNVPTSTDDLAFKIIASHSDSPCFRIKPSPDIYQNGYHKLNTEVYGGAILHTWFDRELSLAGRVYTKNEKDALHPHMHLLNIDKNLMSIVSLCIHQNRDVNKGFDINAQKDTLPILELVNDTIEKLKLEDIIAKELNVKKEDVLDYDLFTYDRQKGNLLGLNDEFIHVGRQDNLAMAHLSYKALIDNTASKFINLIYVSDNEEVGSMTKQGANSPFLKNIMRRITLALGLDDEDFYRAKAKSFMISSDLAHAYHPNYPEKCDITNTPKMGEGVCIKYAANQSYTSDSESASIFKQFADKAGAKVQAFLNRSDTRGGSTIGPISSTQLDIKSVDIGNPILAMHSVREFGSVEDHYNLYKIFEEFFK